ncbi:MAG TPA: DUF4395 domain-containing protein [Bacteroidota bacterium]|nr:DUF4395 domain-containing protein [Bacteroidota bacterium]
MSKIVHFGENVEGYTIPVLNEREIRASAGLLFVAMFFSFILVIFKQNFVPIKYLITYFLTDFLIRVFINPKFSPTLIFGRLIVRNQTPEYVGARQKKFAWIIGVCLAAIMFLHLVIINAYSPITGIICLTCLVFLFFESAFGICLGCKFYPLFFKDKVQYCPGEVCEVKSRQEIQKTSKAQVLVLLGFLVYILLTVFVLNDAYCKKPYDLFGMYGQSTQIK